MCIGVPEFLRQPKIDEVHDIGLVADAYDDVAGFEVTVNNVARMDVLQTTELDITDVNPSVKDTEVKFTYQLPSQE